MTPGKQMHIVYSSPQRESSESNLPIIHQVFIPYLLSAWHCPKQYAISRKGIKAPALMKPIFCIVASSSGYILKAPAVYDYGNAIIMTLLVSYLESVIPSKPSLLHKRR